MDVPTVFLIVLTTFSVVSRKASAPCETAAPSGVQPVKCQEGFCGKLIKLKFGKVTRYQHQCFSRYQSGHNRCTTKKKFGQILEICFCRKEHCRRIINSTWKLIDVNVPLTVISIIITVFAGKKMLSSL